MSDNFKYGYGFISSEKTPPTNVLLVVTDGEEFSDAIFDGEDFIIQGSEIFNLDTWSTFTELPSLGPITHWKIK